MASTIGVHACGPLNVSDDIPHETMSVRVTELEVSWVKRSHSPAISPASLTHVGSHETIQRQNQWE